MISFRNVVKLIRAIAGGRGGVLRPGGWESARQVRTAGDDRHRRWRARGDGHKEGNKMDVMDLAMIATLVVSFVLVKLLADWCDRQMDK